MSTAEERLYASPISAAENPISAPTSGIINRTPVLRNISTTMTLPAVAKVRLCVDTMCARRERSSPSAGLALLAKIITITREIAHSTPAPTNTARYPIMSAPTPAITGPTNAPARCMPAIREITRPR